MSCPWRDATPWSLLKKDPGRFQIPPRRRTHSSPPPPPPQTPGACRLKVPSGISVGRGAPRGLQNPRPPFGGAHEIACESESRLVGRGGRTGGLVHLGQRAARKRRRGRDRCRRHRRRRHERERAGGRRVGDRRNHGPADQVRPDRRHRRSGALRPAGSAEGELPGVRPRVRVGGFPAGPRKPGQHLDLKAVVAPDGRAAAQVYPANYWYGLLEIPKGAISDRDFTVETRACFSCHQVGDQATREVPKSLGSFASTLEAWDHRTSMGPNGAQMSAAFQKFGPQRKAYADWTDRIAAGAYPEGPAASGRRRAQPRDLDVGLGPADQPAERCGRDRRAQSDAQCERSGLRSRPDLRHPRHARSADELGPGAIKVPSKGPVLDAKTPTSPYWGDEPIWKRSAEPRSVALDKQGRVWLTARIRRRSSRRSARTAR